MFLECIIEHFGGTGRNRYAGIITATSAVRSADGDVVEVLADFKPIETGAKPPKVRVLRMCVYKCSSPALAIASEQTSEGSASRGRGWLVFVRLLSPRGADTAPAKTNDVSRGGATLTLGRCAGRGS